MRILSDLQKRILNAEFPSMSFESDPDVERYFEFRSAGRQADALALYNTRLRRKYPDEAQRTLLIRYYRSRDGRYREILRDGMVTLADRVIARTTGIITLLTKDIDSVDMTDAYSVIRLAEGLLSIISPDRYTSIAFTEKYVRYAHILNYRPREMERTAELIRLYVTDTLESVEIAKKEREERRKQRARTNAERRAQAPSFDLSRIHFSPEDIQRILIPSGIAKTEDTVIAYCIKYWNLVTDVAFERTIFLYSRKYKTRHSDIFLAIKNGRTHGWKDEEILNAVLASVVTGYYYSIAGDLYLLRTWARYKQTNMAPQMGTVPDQGATRPTMPRVRAQRRQAAPDGQRSGSRAPARQIAARPAAKPITPFKAQKADVRPVPPDLPQAPNFVPNSIADIIRKTTGKSYTVYKELFFRGIRPSIRAVLSSSASKKGILFGSRQNEAEEIVYDYLYEHYSDPYQNWKDSEERRRAEALGYALPALEPVIEGWIKENA